jgi:predicted RNA-binding protein with PUA-like domain
MNYWLIKTEPSTFSWDKLEQEKISIWDGVRNYQARNNLRKMKVNDCLLFYHSGKQPGIIGLAKVKKEAYPDPTANEGDWSAVDIQVQNKLKRFVPLTELKNITVLSQMVLLKNSRLSVQPVSPDEYRFILKLSGE